MDWQLDEVAKWEQRTHVRHMKVSCETPDSRVWHHAQSGQIQTEQEYLFLEFARPPDKFFKIRQMTTPSE